MSQTHPHTLREFDSQLKLIKDQVLKMGSITQFSLELVSKALLQRDEDAANQMIAEDEELDELELSIDKESLYFLASFAPVASDLRFVLTLSRLGALLERIGDECVSIAKRTKKLLKYPEIREIRLVEPLFGELISTLSRLSTNFEEEDFESIKKLLLKAPQREEKMAKLTQKFTELCDYCDTSVLALAELIFLSRSLERISEGLTKMGEELLYIESASRTPHTSQVGHSPRNSSSPEIS